MPNPVLARRQSGIKFSQWFCEAVVCLVVRGRAANVGLIAPSKNIQRNLTSCK